MFVPSFSVKVNFVLFIIVPPRVFEPNETLISPAFSLNEALSTFKLPSPKSHVPKTLLPESAKLIVLLALFVFICDALVSASSETLEPFTAETKTESKRLIGSSHGIGCPGYVIKTTMRYLKQMGWESDYEKYKTTKEVWDNNYRYY